MSMTERERVARAIGFLEGLSIAMWNMDSDKGIGIAPETAAYYDDQVELLRRAVFEKDDGLERERA